jgi:hypothetical protein
VNGIIEWLLLCWRGKPLQAPTPPQPRDDDLETLARLIDSDDPANFDAVGGPSILQR